MDYAFSESVYPSLMFTTQIGIEFINMIKYSKTGNLVLPFSSIRPWIAETVVAVSEDWLPYLQDLIKLYRIQNVHLVVGGQTRHQSIRICVQYVRERVQNARCNASDVIVIVHDAVRPFVAEETLQRIAEAAHKQGVCYFSISHCTFFLLLLFFFISLSLSFLCLPLSTKISLSLSLMHTRFLPQLQVVKLIKKSD